MATLVVSAGPAEGTHLPLGSHRIVTIGRDEECTFQIVDGEISRKHLQVRFEDQEQRHLAADYRSANGVFINGNRIVRDVPLVDGDRIRIGQSTLVYTTSDFQDAGTALDHVRKMGEWKRSTMMHG